MTASNLNSILQSAPSELQSEAQQSIPLILREALNQGITDQAQLAYILATAEHESKLGRFMREGWDPAEVSAQRYYDAPGDPKGLGNHPNYEPNANYTNGDGYRYRGRGFVQVTGRTHYETWSNKLGTDLVSEPTKAEDPAIAARILVQGMREGSFTKFKLSDYLGEGRADFYNARQIVNGRDQADQIGAIANSYLKALQRVDINQLKVELKSQPSLASQLGSTAEPPSPQLPPLKLGDRHPSVQTLQATLNHLGYSLQPNGIFGSETEVAIKDIQKSQKLAVDGVVGPQTWRALETLQRQAQQSGSALGKATGVGGSSLGNSLAGGTSIGNSLSATSPTGASLAETLRPKPMVQRGDRGKAVFEVQTTLNKLGYGLEVDGIFGLKTEQAVLNFQSRQKLVPDAIVGPKTWQALQQVQQSAIATELGHSAHGNSPGLIKLEPLVRSAGNTHHGAPRSGGRKHAGVDLYNPNASTQAQAPQATLGGVIVKVDVERDAQGNPSGYGHYIDVYNPQLKVVERIAEFTRPNFTQADVGKSISAGTVVGTGATQTEIIHREIRSYETYKQGGDAQYGFAGTVDWAQYMTDLGLYRQEGHNFIPTGRTLSQQYGATPEPQNPGLSASLANSAGMKALEARSQSPSHLQATATAAAALQANLATTFPGENLTVSTASRFTPLHPLADLATQSSSSPQPTPEPHVPAADFELG